MRHLILGNILFMFHHIHGKFKFREFGAAVSNTTKDPNDAKYPSLPLSLVPPFVGDQ